MSIAQQLYHLQELDTEIESGQQALQRMIGQLGESAIMVKLRADLASTGKDLEELKHQQQSLEWEDDDISAKLKKFEEELYSGRIRNPKELSSLQQDIEMLKHNRSKIDDKLLALMDQTDSTAKQISDLNMQFKKVEAQWQSEQKQLNTEIEQTRASLAKLEQERKSLVTLLDPTLFGLYENIKKIRKTAVARIAQGTCSGCHIQLPVTDMQKARSGNVVQCSSCGRILCLS